MLPAGKDGDLKIMGIVANICLLIINFFLIIAILRILSTTIFNGCVGLWSPRKSIPKELLKLKHALKLKEINYSILYNAFLLFLNIDSKEGFSNQRPASATAGRVVLKRMRIKFAMPTAVTANSSCADMQIGSRRYPRQIKNLHDIINGLHLSDDAKEYFKKIVTSNGKTYSYESCEAAPSDLAIKAINRIAMPALSRRRADSDKRNNNCTKNGANIKKTDIVYDRCAVNELLNLYAKIN